MSVVGCKIVVSRKEKLMKNQICVYEMAILDIDAVFCPMCREYKGLMPLNEETLNYLGENLEDWQDYLG
jgi:hypothetical protein